MQTPASVYAPSPRSYPRQVAETEYPDTMLVRSVHSKGHFRWRQHDVCLTEVLWGERVGLLPIDDRWFTVFFATLPIARFDSREYKITRLSPAESFDRAEAGEGDASPSPAPLPLDEEKDKKVSGMCPV